MEPGTRCWLRNVQCEVRAASSTRHSPPSRIFGANPAGPNAGWQLYHHYAFDQAKTRDIFELGGPTRLGKRSKNDPGAVSVFWKQNSLVSFVREESMYRTRIADPNLTYIARSPRYQGVGARRGYDFGSEFGPIFSAPADSAIFY